MYTMNVYGCVCVLLFFLLVKALLSLFMKFPVSESEGANFLNFRLLNGAHVQRLFRITKHSGMRLSLP